MERERIRNFYVSPSFLFERSSNVKESDFQANTIKKLKVMFPGAIITKLDASYILGIPEVLILWGQRWAVFEFKKYVHATKRQNPDSYVDRMNTMSFARVIYT